MPVFAYPLALIGLLAVPLLAAIYWLRNRSREQRVSSLILWLDQREMWEGGRRIHKLQTPLLFFLELFAILSLIAAAAIPMIRAGSGGRPLVIVLDDSFSMLAGDQDSPRNRAAKAIEKELGSNRHDLVRFILAGDSVQTLGEVAGKSEQAINLLDEWKCGSATAKMDESIAFAFELAGSRGRILALTDHAPKQDLSDSRLMWRAFGDSRPNTAIVNATRDARDNSERVLLEIANLSSSSNAVSLDFDSPGGPAPISSQSLNLSPGETRRITMTLKAGAPELRARLSDDALNADNFAILLPESNKVVRTELRFERNSLRALFEEALQSARNVQLTSENPELLITDSAESKIDMPQAPQAWILRIIYEGDASAFLGPFVIDRSHPLTEGISLGGVVWGSGRSVQLPGSQIITAGNVPLLTDLERGGKRELRMRLRPDISNLQETPNWPILIWNLINWRIKDSPGIEKANIRLGADAKLKVDPSIKSASIVDPQQKRRQAPVVEGGLSIRADKVGVYKIDANENEYSFAANALQREESDLTGAASGTWGNWAASAQLQWDYANVAWAFLLIALTLLAIHQWLVARSSVKRRSVG